MSPLERLSERTAKRLGGDVTELKDDYFVVDVPEFGGSIQISRDEVGSYQISGDVPVHPIYWEHDAEGNPLSRAEEGESGELTDKERQLIQKAFKGFEITEFHPHEEENEVHVHIDNTVSPDSLITTLDDLVRSQERANIALEHASLATALKVSKGLEE